MTKDSETLKRRVQYDLLYDYYSPLLTEKQREVYETLYFSDLTPSEAADALGISRQAVHELARNVKEKLTVIERELRFATTTKRLEARIRELEAENAMLRKGGIEGNVREPEG